MVRFLNTTQAKGEIESILTKAQTNIVMISPFIKINDDLVSRLMDAAAKRNVKITMICRKRELAPEERTKLDKIPSLELCFNERVHAKCFYNHEAMVITSLNLYDSSFGDNCEMGVLLSTDCDADKSAFHEAKLEAEFIIREAESTKPRTKVNPGNHSPKGNNVPKARKETSIENTIAKGISKLLGSLAVEGHCIRCGTSIPFNTDAPYCPACYRIWAKYKDDDYEEKFCHHCGQSSESSMKKPLCSSCYRKTH